MPSKARKSFDSNSEDIKKLLDIHASVGGSGPGRRYQLEVINKSAIVLITAFWEAYCEDIASEGLSHIVKHTSSASKLPIELRKTIAKELKKDTHELAVWKLSDSEWRPYLTSRLDVLQESRDRKLNTPKSTNIIQLFDEALGIKDVSTSWAWPYNSVTKNRKKLDDFIELRGAIAHRGTSSSGVSKKSVTEYFTLVSKIAARTGGKVNMHVKHATGKKLY